MTDFLQISLFLLPLASGYNLFRATSAWVKAKAFLLVIGGALLYVLFYQPVFLVNAGVLSSHAPEMIVLVRQLIAPKIEDTTLGIIWAFLLPTNVVLAVTGTRIWEYVNGKKWGTAGFWVLTIYFAQQAFAQTGGWSLVLLTIPSLTSVFAWLQEITHKIL